MANYSCLLVLVSLEELFVFVLNEELFDQILKELSFYYYLPLTYFPFLSSNCCKYSYQQLESHERLFYVCLNHSFFPLMIELRLAHILFFIGN